jgi:hypothetical protein
MTIRNDATRLLIATRDRRRARAVVARQGQVLLDTDLDQQARHQIERIEIETVDSLGSPGRLLVPAGNTGFQITAGGTLATFNIGSGRGYLDGWLLENASVCTLATQPHPRTGDTVSLPSVVAVKSLVRFIDPVEELALADVALGDAQASGQSLNDWQVFPLGLTGTPSCATVLSIAQWQSLAAPSTGTLKVIEQAAAPSTDPCSLTPAGGYTRHENLLYRIEVHAGDVNTTFPSVDGPRFKLHNLKVKLSRRNASVLVRITAVSGAELSVAPASLDSRNWFAPGLHAEIVSMHDDVDPRAALANERLFRVALASDDKVTLEATAAQVTATGVAADGSWFLRLWDTFPVNGAGVALVSAPGAATESAAIDLGDGLTITLGTGGSTGTFRRGDYWTFAARTNGSVDWPKTGGVPDAVRPHGPEVRYAPLAVITPPSVAPAFEDCRVPFATLSDRALLYRGGDGQGVFSPAASGMVPLPGKLRVAVMRGETPAVGVPIRWSFVEPAGGSCLIGGATCNAGNSPETTTDANGLAEVTYAIDASRRLDVHKVQAAIALGPGVASQPPLEFTAVFETAAHTSYEGGKCADLAGATNVQDALDILCARTHGTGCCIAVGKDGEYPTLDAALQDLLKKGERDICICLLSGEHGLKSDIDVKLPGVRLLVHGADRASRLDMKGRSLSFGELAALTFRDFDITDSSGTKGVFIEMCDNVVVSGMRISGLSRDRLSVLHIGQASRIELTSSTVLAYTEEGVKHGKTILGKVPALKEFAASAFALKGLFAEVDRKVVEAMAGMAAPARAQSIEEIAKLTTPGTTGPGLEADEQAAFSVLSRELADPKSFRFAQPLDRLRQALLLSQSGLAVAIGGGDAIMLVADNVIGGRLSVYGEATTPNQALDDTIVKALGPAIKKGDIVLRRGPGDLRLRNNRLREVRIGDDMVLAVVSTVKNGKGPVNGVLSSIIGDANVLAGRFSEMLAFDAALSHNQLRPDGDAVGTVVATQAKYLGNLAHDDSRVFNVGNAAEKFGNGALVIVDL